jgi:hypothetical protein
MTLTTVDPTAIYICDEPFASAHGACRRDDKLRGDHIMVSSHPQFFSPADAPEDERGSVWKSLNDDYAAKEEVRKAADAADRARKAAANRVELKTNTVRAIEDITCEIANVPATLVKGSTITDDDPLAVQFRDLFAPTSKR